VLVKEEEEEGKAWADDTEAYLSLVDDKPSLPLVKFKINWIWFVMG
jgi:hypothetical protein